MKSGPDSTAEPPAHRSWAVRKLVDELRAAGWPIGPDAYMQLIVVLRQEQNWPRERLRSVIAPLLVKAVGARRVFDTVFDIIFSAGLQPIDPFAPPEQVE